jgi:hypothetical protein
MLRIIISKLFFIILLFISNIEVKAATIALPQTGQTACYDGAGTIIACTGTGQDGELQMGFALPNPRFVDNGDQTVTDNLTGLMWTKDCNLMNSRDSSFIAQFDYGQGSVTWQNALNYVKKLNTEKYLGYNDWRLPNVNEIGSILNHGQPTDATWLNLQIFSNIQTTNGFWSSTTDARVPDGAWDMGLGFGYGLISGSIKINSNHVWPVRGVTAPLTIPKTGQNTCYSQFGLAIDCHGTGQDGELQTGVSWPVPRFISNHDQTLTDTLTGLIWSENASLSGSMTWGQALDYIKTINSQNYLGHNDWRLPNINELNSLGHRGLSEPGTWLNTQGFSGVKTSSLTSVFPYWSSTSEPRYYAISGNYSLLYDGADSVWEYYSNAWPVRGGQSGSFLLTISKTGSGTGIVTGSPGIIGWNSNTGTVKYPPNTTVTLTATANNNSSFTSWSGCDSSDANSCNVTMNAAKNVTATFKPFIDLFPPAISFTNPANNMLTNKSTINVAGSVFDSGSGMKSLTINGQEVTISLDGSFSISLGLSNGANTITTVAVDNFGNQAGDVRTIIFDSTVSYPSGDLNGDGGIDIRDALIALRISVGSLTATADNLRNGDVAPLVNGSPAPDGEITVADALVLLRKALGLIDW